MSKNKRQQAADDPVAYLKAAGWRQLGPAERPSLSRCWLPPEASVSAAMAAPKSRQIALPPVRRGLPARIIQQQIVTGGSWYYTLQEALQAQLACEAETGLDA